MNIAKHRSLWLTGIKGAKPFSIMWIAEQECWFEDRPVTWLW